jgi:hypothetical protein
MMQSILPNLRWLTVPSDVLGEDWREKAQEIDDTLAALGMDLAEESVYLLFDRSPGAMAEGEGQCMIARPVVGPKKQLEAPFQLLDWKAAPVQIAEIGAATWPEVLGQAAGIWEDLIRKGQQPQRAFMLRVRRELRPYLTIVLEVLFT